MDNKFEQLLIKKLCKIKKRCIFAMTNPLPLRSPHPHIAPIFRYLYYIHNT